MLRFVDVAPVVASRITADGYLAASVRVARTGIQHYGAKELGRDGSGMIAVYRDAADVFDRGSMGSFAGKPVTIGHPDKPITAENWADLAVGTMGEEIVRDGEAVRVSLALMDADAVKAVQGGMRELSVGYSATLEWGDGIAPDGTPYQARQRNIRVNHLAVVARGRAGPEFRIGDGAASWGASPLSITTSKERHMTDLRTILVDGLQVQTTDQGAAAIDKLTTQVSDAKKAMADAAAAHAKAIADKESALAKVEAERDDLKSKILSDAEIDKRVQARADLLATAAKIAPEAKLAGMSDAAIRKAVVVAKFGDAAVEGKSEDYIEARFDILADGAAKTRADPIRDAMLGGGVQPAPVGREAAEKAYGEMLSNLGDAWKGDAQQKGAN